MIFLLQVMKNLKVLNLTSCHCLERTPIFSAHSNLERLILRGCRSLITIDKSICQLKHLVFLDLSYCENLQRLPNELGRYLARLGYLSLKWCRSLERLPDSIGYLKSLIDLNISGMRIEEIPDSIGNLENLKVVKMEETGIRKIPDAFWTIEKLEEIVGKCTPHHRVHVEIGTCIYKNQSLRILKLTRADIYALPRLPESLIELRLSELYIDMFPDLSNLTHLKELDLVFGRPDSDVKSYAPVECPIPWWMGNLSKLESLKLDSDYVTTSPTELSLLPHLNELCLVCPVLRCLPRLPSSLSSLCLKRCYSLCSMEGLLNLKKLSSLEISSAAIMDIQGLGCLENLRDLRLLNLQQVGRLLDLSNLNKLKCLEVRNCGNLVEIRGELPQSLQELLISYCESLEKLPDLSNLKELQQVDIAGCTKLKGEAILSSTRRSHANLWENLQYLRICGLGQVEILPNLSNLKKLRCLQVENCGDLVEIQGELSQFLEELNISSCESLKKLPGLSSLKGLRRVKIYRCGKLNVEAISRLCLEMSIEFVG
ncbi:disease resistance protein RPV1-like [Eucalyptus grandis]|uniref:disease resistance protein RPV1-like n=1 Tax=Eucalyptus grandis TaxID=71139 RepID=UPI00192F0FAD|nr:disease resistance protein RPV1-like [Eucalyptus grandis]